MNYCVKCGSEATICHSEKEKSPKDEYLGALKECNYFQCYCNKHVA